MSARSFLCRIGPCAKLTNINMSPKRGMSSLVNLAIDADTGIATVDLNR